LCPPVLHMQDVNRGGVFPARRTAGAVCHQRVYESCRIVREHEPRRATSFLLGRSLALP
jgi:hypothetical protein